MKEKREPRRSVDKVFATVKLDLFIDSVCLFDMATSFFVLLCTVSDRSRQCRNNGKRRGGGVITGITAGEARSASSRTPIGSKTNSNQKRDVNNKERKREGKGKRNRKQLCR